MADPAVYLEKLSAFSRMLRLEGLPVSPGPTVSPSIRSIREKAESFSR